MAVDLLHQEPARTVGDPFAAYVPGEVTQVSRMTNVHPKFLEKSPRYRGSRPFAPRTRENRGRPIYGLSSWRSRPDIEDDQCFWKNHLGIVEVDLQHQEPARTVVDPSTAYFPGELTQVLRMTNVHLYLLEKSPR